VTFLKYGRATKPGQGYKMVRPRQVYHSPVGQYGGSKPEVVNKNSEKLERIVYLLFYTS